MAGRSGEDNGLSGLPEEWGKVVVPDDAAELDDLAAEVREELRFEARVSRREKRLPFIVLALTVMITLASLFAVPWLGGNGGKHPSPESTVSVVSPQSGPSRANCPQGPDCESSSPATAGSST